jgi:hypothetical protein
MVVLGGESNGQHGEISRKVRFGQQRISRRALHGGLEPGLRFVAVGTAAGVVG